MDINDYKCINILTSTILSGYHQPLEPQTTQDTLQTIPNSNFISIESYHDVQCVKKVTVARGENSQQWQFIVITHSRIEGFQIVPMRSHDLWETRHLCGIAVTANHYTQFSL